MFWEEIANTDFVSITFLFRTVESQGRMVHAHKWQVASGQLVAGGTDQRSVTTSDQIKFFLHLVTKLQQRKVYPTFTNCSGI